MLNVSVTKNVEYNHNRGHLLYLLSSRMTLHFNIILKEILTHIYHNFNLLLAPFF